MGEQFNLEDINSIGLNNHQWMMVIQGLQRNLLYSRNSIAKHRELYSVDADPKNTRAIAAYREDIEKHQDMLKLIRQKIFTNDERKNVPDF